MSLREFRNTWALDPITGLLIMIWLTIMCGIVLYIVANRYRSVEVEDDDEDEDEDDEEEQ